MRTIDIVALGHLFNENIRWPDGRMEGPYLGSTAAYSAVLLGNIQAPAGFVSIVGKDTSSALLQPIYDCGIDLEGFCRREGASEIKNILNYYEDGKKMIEYLTRSPEIEFSDIPKSYLCARAFHLCLVDYDVPLRTLDAIRAACPDALITADLGGAGGAHSTAELRTKYIEEANGSEQKRYLRQIDIGKASIEDAELAFGRPFKSYQDVAAVYIEAGVGMMVVTMGGDGVYILDSNGKETVVDAVTPYNGVIDTTGAGDTYITAFVAEYLRTDDIVHSAYFAGAASALLIEKTGGVKVNRTPTRAQIDRRLTKYMAKQQKSF